MPGDIAPDGPLDQTKVCTSAYAKQQSFRHHTDDTQGPLSFIGDPVGKVLHTGLKPTVGAVTGAIGEPHGEAAERVQNVARNESKWKGDKENVRNKDLPGGERIGGNRQSADNPLGL